LGLKKLAILGSTGSIGTSALKVVEENPGRFQIVSLAAALSVERLALQAIKHRPALLAVRDAHWAERLRALLPAGMKARVVHGPQGYLEAATAGEPDLVVSAMVGAAGLMPTYAALKSGRDVALANKETLVAGGQVVMAEARKNGAALLPVDSEHSAIFQALRGEDPASLSRIWLTASGGPFREFSAEELAKVTPQEALAHPNWSMGPKITVDSATLMNKGLEAIEAHWLFDQPLERIQVVIHPQSIVHSLVEYLDGSVIAQMGPPDMRGPIAYALGFPERISSGLTPLDLTQLGQLSFHPPDPERFPALELAYQAGREGGSLPAVLNAANEVAVAAFLNGSLSYPGITDCVRAVMDDHKTVTINSVADVLETDRQARAQARDWLERH
jgi:1-deoxy-D-xylulose-5-phosphate reductoisomerase